MPKKIEDVISEYGFYVTETKGTSMYPLIKSDCSDVCIVKTDFPLKKYDVPLYIRKDGTYVLHRVLGKTEKGYICCGDNQCVLEYGVTEDMIIGKLDSWYRKEKKYTVRDKGYLRYVNFWCKSLKRRRILLWFLWKGKRFNTLARAAFRKVFKRRKAEDK